MPYQRSGRDYGPGSTGGTTKYSSRKQVSIGVPDRNTRKKTPKPAPKPVQPAKKDPGVAAVPGGLTGRGQNNPAMTDPGVMGVPSGVTGRQAPVTRQKQPSAGSDSTLGFGPMQPTRMDPYLSFTGTPNTQQQRERSTPATGQRGGSTPTNTSTGLTFDGPVNGIPWSSGHLPLASSSLANLTLGSLEPQSPPLTAEEQQELEYYRQKREAFRRGETIARNAWELNTAPPKTASAPKQGGYKKGPASNTSPELYGTLGDSVFDLGINRAHTDTLQPQVNPQDLAVFDPQLQFGHSTYAPTPTLSPQDMAVFERELKREMTQGAADKAAPRTSQSQQPVSAPRTTVDQGLYPELYAPAPPPLTPNDLAEHLQRLEHANQLPSAAALNNAVEDIGVMGVPGGLTKPQQNIDALVGTFYENYDFDPEGPDLLEKASQDLFEATEVGALRYIAEATGYRFFERGTPEHDAFEHIYGSFSVARLLGPDAAKSWGDANETRRGHRFQTTLIDLHNNKLGRQIAEIPDLTGERAIQVIVEAIRKSSEGHSSPAITELPGEMQSILGRTRQPR